MENAPIALPACTVDRADRIETAPRWLLRVGVSCVAAALTGCATLASTADQPARPLEVPATWSAASSDIRPVADPAALAAWWQRFDEPLLTSLIEQALAANTDIGRAQANLQQARAAVDQARAGLAPALDAGASAQRARSGDASARNNFSTSLDASWEIDLSGRLRSGVAAAGADAQASAANLANTQVSIAAEVAIAYAQLRGTQARLEFARQNLAAQEQTLQIARWREQAGLTTRLDVEQARTATEQTRAALPNLTAAIEQTMHALGVLTGQAPAALKPRLALTPDQPAAIPDAPDELAIAFPADTLRQRPDVRAAQAQVEAARARVAQAAAARYPNLRLGGSLGLSALTLGSLTGPGAVASAILGSLSMPLFDGGAIQAGIDAQEAALAGAYESYRAAVLTALRDVEDALIALQASRERLSTLQVALESARNASQLANDRYRTGLVDFQAVLDTQRALLSLQDSVATTQADISIAHVQLYKALGGGWSADVGAAAVPSQQDHSG